MDEVFLVFDLFICCEMQDQFFELQGVFNKIIIFIIYDFNEVMYLGDYIVVMCNGCVVQIGIFDEIFI